MNKTRYILMVLVDPQKCTAVGMVKKKGPSFLIGKITFPGGKIEPGETPAQAASRELIEEAGIEISPDAWLPAGYKSTNEYELHVVVSASDAVCQARTMEEEPVFVMNLDEHYKRACDNPCEYTPDFIEVIDKCFKALVHNSVPKSAPVC